MAGGLVRRPRVGRSRLETKNPQPSLRQLTDARASLATRREEEFPGPDSLRHVFDDSAAHLDPGDVIVLGDSESLRSQVEPGFFAVLACPRCGTLNLITPSQYFGTVPVICGSNSCPCSFRIKDECRIDYMPVS